MWIIQYKRIYFQLWLWWSMLCVCAYKNIKTSRWLWIAALQMIIFVNIFCISVKEWKIRSRNTTVEKIYVTTITRKKKNNNNIDNSTCVCGTVRHDTYTNPLFVVNILRSCSLPLVLSTRANRVYFLIEFSIINIINSNFSPMPTKEKHLSFMFMNF